MLNAALTIFDFALIVATSNFISDYHLSFSGILPVNFKFKFSQNRSNQLGQDKASVALLYTLASKAENSRACSLQKNILSPGLRWHQFLNLWI